MARNAQAPPFHPQSTGNYFSTEESVFLSAQLLDDLEKIASNLSVYFMTAVFAEMKAG
jgi:hypothetical protein